MRLILAACFGLGLAMACGGGDSHAQGAGSSGGGVTRGGTNSSGGAGVANGGKTNTGGERAGAGVGNTVNEGGAAGRDDSAGGDAVVGGDAAVGGDGPIGGAPGHGSGGSAAAGASNATGGRGEPMFPCDSDSVSTEPNIAAVCAPGSDFILGNAVPVDAGNAARLIAVTPDELSIAWASFGSSSELYFVADRASSEDAFDAPVRLETTGSVVGMSPDGLRLVTLSNDRRAYSELTRSVRHTDFGADTNDAFTLLDARAAKDDLAYADGVIAADDHTFVYTARSSDSTDFRVLISTRTAGEPWPVGEPVAGCELETHGALARHPTGIAADGLTLFFYDPDRGTARAAWRTGIDAPFSFFRDLPGMGLVAPAAACDKLYYTGSVGQTPLLIAKNGH